MVERRTVSEDKKTTNLNPLYVRSVVNSLGAGMVSPFMGDYAQKLGVTSTEMGWFQSSANLSNNMMQVFWGRLSDRLGRRIPSLIGGYMAGYLEGYFGQVVALQIVYMISTAGRALGAVWHLGLDETLKNP